MDQIPVEQAASPQPQTISPTFYQDAEIVGGGEEEQIWAEVAPIEEDSDGSTQEGEDSDVMKANEQLAFH